MARESGSESVHPGSSWGGDVWGGLAAMLVALPSSIAFGVAVYSTMGASFVGRGAVAGIVGAALLGILAPLIGRTTGLISQPCAPSAAVLSAFVIGLAGTTFGSAHSPEAIIPLMVLVVLSAALLQILYGAIGGGRLIKFIPYPVVSGYLSGVGMLIAISQLPKLLGLPKGIGLLAGIVSPANWSWQGLVVGVITLVLVAVSRRITTRLPGAILGLLGGVVAYFALARFFPAMARLDGNPLLIGSLPVSGQGFVQSIAEQWQSFRGIDVAMLRMVPGPALTLSVLVSIDTLKTCVVLDTQTRQRHNSNRELIGQGVGNLFAGLAGGMPGAGAMGPSMVNITSGGRTARAGVLEGVFVIVALVLLGPLIAWIPISALAGIMMVIAFRMFDWNMFHLLKSKAGRLDFAVIAGVILTALTVDLIVASAVGVALAILLFIRDRIKESVIRQKLYLTQISSKTKRVPADRDILNKHGKEAVFCELQGNLFFGTTDQLYTHLDSDLHTARYILLDLRRVHSLDYTAAHLFELIQSMLEDRKGRLLFSGMPSALIGHQDFQAYLAQVGVVNKSSPIKIFETLDSALEWMEEQILKDQGIEHRAEEGPLDLKEFGLFRDLDDATLGRLRSCIREVSAHERQRIFSRGEEGDDVFFVRRGAVRILLPLEGGQQHHVATIGRGDFFGEIAFLDRGQRSANAEAKSDTDLYALSRSRFDESPRANAESDAQLFSHLAIALSRRLRQADVELQALEER